MRTKYIFPVICLAAALVPFLTRGNPESRGTGFPGWPKVFGGRPLSRLALSEREKRFSEGFPGHVATFTDGREIVLLRWLPNATRRLHPASDCYRGLGYHVTPLPLSRDPNGAVWGAFRAEKKGSKTLFVRERIWDRDGNGWSDVSAWYWSALLGRTSGPWWSAAIAEEDKAADHQASRDRRIS